MGARFSPFAGSCLVGLAIGALACGIVAVAMSKAAKAQSVIVYCGEWKTMAARLKDKFGEEPISRGQVDERTAVVVFGNPEGNFTILRVNTRGKACVVTSGQGWDQAVVTAGGL